MFGNCYSCARGLKIKSGANEGTWAYFSGASFPWVLRGLDPDQIRKSAPEFIYMTSPIRPCEMIVDSRPSKHGSAPLPRGRHKSL